MFSNPTFWVFVSFVGFVALVGKKAHAYLTAMLDERSKKISDQIENAENLLNQAQKLLAEYQQKHEDATNESVEIIARSEREAMELEKESKKELQHQMKLREEFCLARITQAEKETKDYLKERLLHDALNIVEEALKDNVVEEEKITAKAISELEKAQLKV